MEREFFPLLSEARSEDRAVILSRRNLSMILLMLTVILH